MSPSPRSVSKKTIMQSHSKDYFAKDLARDKIRIAVHVHTQSPSMVTPTDPVRMANSPDPSRAPAHVEPDSEKINGKSYI